MKGKLGKLGLFQSKIYKRITSVLLASALTVNVVSFDVFQNGLDLAEPLTAYAAYVPSDTSDEAKARFSGTNGTVFQSTDEGKNNFLDFCYFYANDDAFAELYDDATVSVSFITFPDDFSGLGNAEVPFKGDFRIQDNGNSNVQLPCALFTHVCDSAKITNANGDPLTLKIIKTSDASSALVAEHVYHDNTEGATASSWDITAASSNSNTYAGVIGTMEDNAKLTLTYTNNSSAAVTSTSDGTVTTADVGAICGTMKTDSELTVSVSALPSALSISSANGNAGGFVGAMKGTSKLIITALPSGYKPTVTASSTDTDKGYAGGVVGSMLSSATVDTSALGSGAFAIDGTITGGNAAGGYAGRYVNSAENATLDLSVYSITATVSGPYNGGVFGLLENQSAKYTITNGSTINSKTSSGTYGGIIGKYTTSALTDTLYLSGLNANATALDTCSFYGGAIGLVGSAAYIKAENVTVTAAGTDKGWFGGLIGETSETNGVFIDLGDFTLNTGTTENDTFTAENFTGGGIVGTFNNGVLRLSGTTDMTNGKPADGANGQLIGINDNVLTYAVDSNWTYKRSSGANCDDLGTWGEVVRVGEAYIVTYDPESTAHTVTLLPAVKSMGTYIDFAKTALNMQLNQGSDYDCLCFAKVSGGTTVDTANTRATLLAATDLKLAGSFSLSGTGITGFMRDGGENVGIFTGTFDGANGTDTYTITLATGEPYGYNVTPPADKNYPTVEGVGQIYRHKYNGLFSVLGGTDCTVKNLTVDGVINVSNCVDGMNTGGVAAVNGGDVTLTSITAKETVNYNESTSISGTEAAGKNIGGFIGQVKENATITINGDSSIEASFNLKGNHKSWNVYGGAIGKITASEFTVDVGTKSDDDNKLTNKLTVAVSDMTNGSNSDSGGLIGYIINTNNAGTDCSKRVINLNNLEYNGCSIVNPATTNGGGLFGYAWLNTSANVNGVTVTDATITNSSAPNVGAMLYMATGKMKVDSLAIDKLTMTGGAGTSLGMIVNKAFRHENKVTHGLYLNVLNSGYTYTTSGITLPETITVYDELAAYTAKDEDDVIKGYYKSGEDTYYGAGVVSINMGTRTDGVVSVAATGTYQNKMTAQTKPNKYARYYYNLDKMSKSDATQDVVLWSVKNYAATNISGEFDSNDTPLNKDTKTNINFTGISFYPVYSASGSVKNVNLTFDYSGLYAAESVFSNNESTDTDSYIRDPGAVDVTENDVTTLGRNQHYLMQSGLFISGGEGSTLTVNSSALSGTFLEVGDYSGVLISGTTHGSVKIDGLELDGITPKTTGNADYKNGYLLVNSIKRDNTQSGLVTLDIQDVKTGTDSTKKYATETVQKTTGEGESAETTSVEQTKQVAKSLFGAVYGPGLNIKFEKMKLDAREPGTLSSNTPLNGAYGTLNSIFTDSTFFASLQTDSMPMPSYNYSYEEDWGTGNRAVTYGYEVNNSAENRDRQHMYYKSEDKYTAPEQSATSAIYTGFSSGWLPYVKKAYEDNQTPDTNGCYFRELRVNISEVVTSEGCGTYNDPYVIDSEKSATFEKIATFLKTSNGSQLPTITLPLDYDSYCEGTDDSRTYSIAKLTSGSRWCTNKSDHAVFTYDSTSDADNYTYTYTPDDGTSTTVKWPVKAVRLYLESAYYVISEDITLNASFPGLGGVLKSGNDNASGNYAFRGVIIGKNVTITNNSQSPLISISNGSVVKNLTVVQNVDVTLTQETTGSAYAAFGYKTPVQTGDSQLGCNYYGGIIGEIMGGDNIIDNCYVQQAEGKKITLNGTNGNLCPVGSYVGVVVFGGLIFKNMAATTANNNAKVFKVYYDIDTENNLNSATAKGAIYVNPYVGRVINGYAVNETKTQFSMTEDGHYHDEDSTARKAADGTALTQHSLKNTTKHYTITDINQNESDKLEVASVPTSTTNDGIINIPNSQAFFVLSLITQSLSGTATTADGDYVNSLSYGINSDTVYGKSHNAEYSDVGTNKTPTADNPETDEDETVTVDDYTTLASADTAANTAVPYIIKNYTKNDGSYTINKTQVTSYDIDDLDGKTFIIAANNTNYLVADQNGDNLNCTTTLSYADKFIFNRGTGDNSAYYTISYVKNGATKYLKLTTSSPWQFTISDEPAYFTLTKSNNNNIIIKESTANRYVNWSSNKFTNGTANTTNFSLWTATGTTAYPARCVTSTVGYYDINLTGSNYVLPDSFRGVGAVGYCVKKPNNDDVFNDQCHQLRIDSFNGNNASIDEDIYLNRYAKVSTNDELSEHVDNYFDVLHSITDQSLQDLNKTNDTKEDWAPDNMNLACTNTNVKSHGIGLFDAVLMKNSSSSFKNFTLSGSVNIENYTLSTTVSGSELKDAKQGYAYGGIIWLSAGGVCGWSTRGYNCNFEGITLNSLSVRGTAQVGGLLADSGIKGYKQDVIVTNCSAKNLSIELTGSAGESWRSSIGAFVGKCKEGTVEVHGDETNKSTVTLKKYACVGDAKTVCGGLVGYAGADCRISDMIVKTADGADTVTIGASGCGMSGGLVGLMQPATAGSSNCKAEFTNCQIINTNIVGNYCGGLYAGTHGHKDSNNNYSPYSITIDNCQMVGGYSKDGETVHNTITGTTYVGGFVGDGFVVDSGSTSSPNIKIYDSSVSNYDITSTNNKGHVGGFIGYCGALSNKSVVAYVHDCSVEECTLGDADDYVGGVVGWICNNQQNSSTYHKILGYNIKLNNVSTVTTNTLVGCWIGRFEKPNSSQCDVQLSGIAIYGTGITKNVGAGSLTSASFVYADYDSACKNMTEENKNKATFNIDYDVDMPKYPYVNVNPQSNMGIRSDSTNAVISGDGAVLLDKNVPTYSTYTSGQTMAAKLYSQLTDTSNSRRYTTFADIKDNVIADGHKLDYYMKRTTTDDGDRISTYKTEKGNLPNGVEDFACIMISTADSAETTNLINQYIRLVTNTTDDYAADSEYYTVDVKTCKLVKDTETGKGEFKLITDSTDEYYSPSVELSGGQFKMVKANADSTRTNTFTLIDVQFKDPLNTSKVAYHLYVPVYTTVQMEVDFYATAMTGNHSVIYQTNGIAVQNSDYNPLLSKEDYPEYIFADNLNSWYTMYFRFSYDKSDLESMLNAGNLNWNHDKYVNLEKNERSICNMLSESTFMTLVDPNGGADKVYYVNGFNSTDFPRVNNNVKLDFTKFKGADGSNFEVSTLNEMVAQSITAETVSGTGQYKKYTGEGKPTDFNTKSYVYTIDASGSRTYYEFVSTGGDTDLAFKNTFTGLNEDYYVSVYVPETNMSKIYGYEITIDDKFPAPDVLEGSPALPKSAKVNNEVVIDNKTKEVSRQVYLGDLYDQTVSFEIATQDPVITSSNKTLDAYATTTIKAKSIPVLDILVNAGRYMDLYHSYVLTLDRHGEQGEVSTLISGLDDMQNGTKRVQAWYSFESQISSDDNPTEAVVNSIDVQSNYINVGTVKESDKLITKIAPNVTNITEVTIYSRVRMDFDDSKIDVEFPQKTRTDAGVSARVASNLAYSTDGLAFSSSSKPANDRLERLFYRTSMDTASLYYNPETPDFDKYDYDGEYSENYTRVGVNGRNSMSEYMPIDTLARYDLQKVAQMWDEGENVQLTISLQKKVDDVETANGVKTITKVRYADLNDITKYWGGLELKDGKPIDKQLENGSYQLTPKDTTSIWVESGDYKREISVLANTQTIVVTIPKNQVEYDSSTNEAKFHISFNAKTGANFTEYANYKVNLTVQLLNSSGDTIETCTASDYVIYTNAKINNEFIE